MLDPASLTPVIVLAVLLIIHAFFAMAKEAIVSIRRSRRLQLVEESNHAAELVNNLAEDATRLLTTEQLILKFLGFFFIGFAAFVYTLPLAQLISINNFAAMIMVTIAAVLITLIFGELIPREIARNYAEPIALWSIYPFNLLSYVAAPLARLITKIGRGLTGRWDEPGDYGLGTITEEDLRTYVDAGEEGGLLKEEEKEMIYSIFDLGDTLAREIMVPRIDIVAVEADTAVVEALDTILEAGHSRVPVYDDNIDNVIGILYAKDLLAHWRNGGDPRPVRGLEREVYYVPETKPVSDLLRELQSKKVHIAIVVDEYGGTAGLVTIEDILEEIVGEIQDEYDTEEFLMECISDDEYIFSARIDLDDVNDIMAVELPTDESDTLGGLVYSMLGRVPVVGDSLEVANLQLTVLAVEGRRIVKVKVQRIKQEEENGKQSNKEKNELTAAAKKSSAFVNNPRNVTSSSS
ncbi:MAG: hemolysin family protein [Anaerolineae bacterium]|nr:hemolysin family protein [Anaerolineae bacterium]